MHEESKNEYKYIGKRIPIRDAALKVTGQLKYVGDMSFDHMLHAKLLLSPVAHAKIKRIDTSKAEALPGVKAVATYINAPRVQYNSAVRFYEHKIPEVEYIFDDTVRFIGDRVAAVAAVDEAVAAKAVKLIEVEYEELPAVFNEEEALDENAVKIHEGGNIVCEINSESGNVDEAFGEADRIFEDKYKLPAIHHGAIEPHVAIASYDARGKLTVYSPNQNTFAFRVILSKVLSIPMSKVRVVRPAIGGSFGGKLEATVEPVAALLAKMTGGVVKLELSRTESMIATRTRHAATVYLKTGVKNDGRIVAQYIRIITNTGAYASSAFNVIAAMSHKLFKMYDVKNVRFKGTAVYTNTTIAGAMRGYGSPQGFIGQQLQLNKIARALNMDTAELQLKNLVKPDGVDHRYNSPIGNPRPIDCVLQGREVFNEMIKNEEDLGGEYCYGTGMSMGAHGNGVAGAHRDMTSLMMKMNEDGTAVLYTGTHDMGNGSVSLQTQIIGEILSIDPGLIEVIEADTDASPWNLGDYASRGAFVSGSAAKLVAQNIRAQLIEEAARLLEEPAGNITLDNGFARTIDGNKSASLCDVVVSGQQNYKEIIAQETFAATANVTSYGAHFVRVAVNKTTGAVKVLKYAAAHDVGTPLNPLSVEGQIEGAIQMGIGYALTEGIIRDSKGKMLNASLRKYHMITASEMPDIKVALVDGFEKDGPFGGKSIGECSVVPSAPAVCNAVANALNMEIHELPVNTIPFLIQRQTI